MTIGSRYLNTYSLLSAILLQNRLFFCTCGLLVTASQYDIVWLIGELNETTKAEHSMIDIIYALKRLQCIKRVFILPK